jgi:L-alanine-DL-glutamate epimerase-like enolase superfamily enzyme
MDLWNCNEPTIPAFKEIIDTYNKYPATVSGVEQAFLSLYAKVNHLAIQEIFSAPTHPFVNVNGLIGFGTPQDVLKKIQNLVEEGYRTIKLKMGYEDFATEKEILNSIPKEYDNIKFRLDLNAAIDTDEALSRLDFYMKFNIEYIEDLFRDDHQYETIELPSSIKFAAEISPYSKTRFDKLLNIPSLSYLIAKPSISGSLFQMIEIKKFAQQFNKKLVITHAVDGRIGMKKSLVLAALIDGSTAHGLMPVYMEEDVNTIEIPRIQRGSYSTTNLEL